jgi:hypothetical protein
LSYGIDAYRRCHLHAQEQERYRVLLGYGTQSYRFLLRLSCSLFPSTPLPLRPSSPPDLATDYWPPICYPMCMGFWQRLFGRKEKEKPTPTPDATPARPEPPPQDAQVQTVEAWIDAATDAAQLEAEHVNKLIDGLVVAGRQAKVIGLLRRALVRFPEHVPTLMRLAVLAVDRREIDAAKPALLSIVNLGAQAERARAHFMLAELEENAGRKQEARVHYEATLALDFHYPLARERAQRLSEEQGQPNSSYVQHTITQGVSNSSIGRFVLQRELGRGGAGAVYLATDNQLNRQVALKILHPHLASKENERAKFVSEATTASSLHHPNIIRIYDIDESISGIMMEHLSGGTLKERISAGIEPRTALVFCREIAATLSFIHQRGLIHRDLKPANLLFRASGTEGGAGRLILTDFGVAHGTGQESQGVVGTLAYMAPEQRLGKDLTPAADLYALGVILYESLVGSLPYSQEEVTRGEVHFPIEQALQKVPQGAHSRLEPLLRALLSSDPGARPESASLVEEELRRVISLLNLGQDAQAIFTDAIEVAKLQGTLRPEVRRALTRAAQSLGVSPREAASIAKQSGLSSDEPMTEAELS